jgi:hypothetical protein
MKRNANSEAEVRIIIIIIITSSHCCCFAVFLSLLSIDNQSTQSKATDLTMAPSRVQVVLLNNGPYNGKKGEIKLRME